MNIALEILGDRWTLLILRDMLFGKCSTFREFQKSPESIATNILSDRLKKLQAQGIITGERSAEDARVISYRPTEKGLELLPAMIELILWAARYEQTAATPRMLKRLTDGRVQLLEEIRQRFTPRPAD